MCGTASALARDGPTRRRLRRRRAAADDAGQAGAAGRMRGDGSAGIVRSRVGRTSSEWVSGLVEDGPDGPMDPAAAPTDNRSNATPPHATGMADARRPRSVADRRSRAGLRFSMAIEDTLTAGYARALELEAERMRLERRAPRSGGRRGSLQPWGGAAGELGDSMSAGAADRLTDGDALDVAACCSARCARRGVGRPRGRPASLLKRFRCGPRTPRPGCGSRSAASSGCSRCGSSPSSG